MKSEAFTLTVYQGKPSKKATNAKIWSVENILQKWKVIYVKYVMSLANQSIYRKTTIKELQKT